jgi:hypothetical protein
VWGRAPRKPALSEVEGAVPSTARRLARDLLMLADGKHIPVRVLEPGNFVAAGRGPDS